MKNRIEELQQEIIDLKVLLQMEREKAAQLMHKLLVQYLKTKKARPLFEIDEVITFVPIKRRRHSNTKAVAAN